MNSLATLRWNHGGRNVSCATSQRGGKIAKSMFAVPGTSLGEVSTVKIDGSGWSKLIEPMALKRRRRSEEHTSELQSLMRNSYAVFCLKKKKKTVTKHNTTSIIIQA